MVAIANLPLLFTAVGPREGSLNTFSEMAYILHYKILRNEILFLPSRPRLFSKMKCSNKLREFISWNFSMLILGMLALTEWVSHAHIILYIRNMINQIYQTGSR